jgi:2-C-methyl-D-erythritol 2,4-cyclodiphosphate synthase
MRTGIGYDIHRLVEDRKLVLGGVDIPYVKGLLGYSDADVLIHAISDAMLGALALGDIGEHFPNTDPKWRNISSVEILTKAFNMVSEKGFTVNNIDSMIIAEEPKLYPFKDLMVEKISGALGIGKDRVSVKATTNEGVGALGKGDAIAAYAVVTLTEIKTR